MIKKLLIALLIISSLAFISSCKKDAPDTSKDKPAPTLDSIPTEAPAANVKPTEKAE